MSAGDRPGLKPTRPWQAERPGAAAGRQNATDELFTLVAFDVPCDKTRRKVGEMCKDYGLTRSQWSVFEGPMTRNRREELSARIGAMLEAAEGGGRVAVHPIGQREAAWSLRLKTKGIPIRVQSPPAARERARDDEDLSAVLADSVAAASPPAKAGGAHG